MFVIEGRTSTKFLSMTVREAISFFREVTKITNRLKVLDDVGLGYLRAWASRRRRSPAARLNASSLAAHLLKRTGAKTLYIFDEPTTGVALRRHQQTPCGISRV